MAPTPPSQRGSCDNVKAAEVRCQLHGCTNNPMGTVLRRYRVCARHLAEPVVEQDGQKQRFCRQCRKFHPLDCFEGDHRNCSEKLRKHNQRRRVKRQQRKASREEAVPCEEFLESCEASPTEDDCKNVPASLRAEFLRLRGLQKHYNPLSSTNSLLTTSTAVQRSWDEPAQDTNVETSKCVNESGPVDGQSVTNASNSPDATNTSAQLLSSSSLRHMSTASLDEAPSPEASNTEKSWDYLDTLQQAPLGWKPNLLPHECIHICAGHGCYLCRRIDPYRNPAKATPGWKLSRRISQHLW